MMAARTLDFTPADAPADLEVADRDAFVAAMAGAVTGVTVITTDGPAGRFGLTVSATASVSADPPMVLACLNTKSPAAAAVRANGVFGLNLLGAAQSAIADVFAGRAERRYDFGCADWTEAATGSPLLADAVAALDCRVVSTQVAGTHLIVIGRVARVTSTAAAALAHSRRAYGAIAAR